MPAGVYFRQAAADLRNAIMELRRDIDNRRKAITENEQQMHRRKDELNRNRNAKGTAASQDSLDPQQKANLMRAANEDLGEISRIERDFMQTRDRLLQEIARAEQDIIGLEGQARSFESRQNQ